jgi:hypothetical protein
MAVIEAIQTTYLENNDVQIVTFASIPATYEHLQLRVSTHDLYAVGANYLLIRLNNDSGSNYSSHFMEGYGSSTFATGETGQSYGKWGTAIGANNLATEYSNSVIDILDYANTNKNTTVQYLSGFGTGLSTAQNVKIGSSLWDSTAAVTEIDVYVINTPRFQRGTEFTLYGLNSS